MIDFRIQNLPACRDYKGREYPARVGLTLICSRGMRWPGGEFATREEAVAEGERRTSGPLARLRHHVTGAIERGEAQPIVCIPAGGAK
jgi:hypothetical protein